MNYMGLDIGTTGCKAVAFDEQGKVAASAYREYPVLSPAEGWAELDSRQVIESCADAIREAAWRLPRDSVRGLSISSQGEAFTPVDGAGRMLGNAMVSSDVRAAKLAEEWSQEFGRWKLYEITGHTAHPMFTLFKLLWLRDNRPNIWNEAAGFHCFEDLMHRRLGVGPAMSWPLAGRTMIFDVCSHKWDPGILSAVGLDATRLAPPVPSGTIVGRLTGRAARDLGLAKGAAVVAGGHDQPCGALGAGVISKGRAVYSTGTVECITPAFPKPIFSQELFESNLCTYDFTAPGMYTTVAFSLTGGNLLKWFRDQFGLLEVREASEMGTNAYELLLSKLPKEPTDLMVLPYFTPSGTPHFDVETRGAIFGLRLTTTREEILRALLEGVAFEMRLNVHILERSGIHIEELVAIGGGAKSREWLELKADVLGKPIARAAVTEAGCLGAAMLARAADCGEDLPDLVKRWVRIEDVIEPNPDRAELYAERFGDYLEIYPLVKSFYKTT